jgi:hypothetical protein
MLAALVLAAVVAPSAVRAAGVYEPNDEVAAATGPIAPQSYSGTFDTDQDEDWYWIPLAAQQQVDVAVHFSEFGCSYGGRAYFMNSRGETLGTLDAIEQGYGGEEGEEPLHFKYTTPRASGVYYLRFVGAAPPCAYEFSVAPASAYAAGIANPAVHFPEPDNYKNSAHGPIGAEVLYSGAIDAAGDVDQLYLEAAPDAKIEMELFSYCDGGVQAAITNTAQRSLNGGLEASEGTARGGDLFETGPGGRIYVAISGDVGCHWMFRVSPSSALAPPPVPVDPCARAEAQLRDRKRAVKHLERAFHRARTRRARGHLHHRIEAKRRAARAAKHQVAVACG